MSGGDARRWTPRTVLLRAIEVLRHEGVIALLFKVLGETVYRRAIVIARPLDEPIPAIVPRVPVEIGLLEETEAEEYARLRPEVDAAEVRRRLREGDLCFVARHSGRLAHVSWTATGRARIDYLGCVVPLAAGEVYTYETTTAAELRGRDIAPAVAAFKEHYLRRRGHRRLVGIVMPENRKVLGSFHKTGYRPIGVMGCFRLGRWRRDFHRMWSGASPLGEPAERHDARYWDRVARRLHPPGYYLDPFLGALKRDAHLALVRRWDATPPRGRALKTDLFEEAFGSDAFLGDLASKERLIVGMDISIAVIERARRCDPERRAHYVVADVRHLPFASGAFATVVSPSTLDHFAEESDLRGSLRELARVLEPGGRAVITLDNPDNILDPLLRLVSRMGLLPYYVGCSLRVTELEAALRAAGLDVLGSTAILHNPRLLATAAVAAANRLGWRPLIAAVRRTLVAAQRLERSRWRYRTGSFVAAGAVKPGTRG